MHSARLGLMLAVVCACAPPDALWRDQFVFVGDDGNVVVLAVQRRADGQAELKGWQSAHGKWRRSVFWRPTISRKDAEDLATALASMSEAPEPPARVVLEERGPSLEIRLRAPAERVGLFASALVSLGRYSDPEGTSLYQAGRAQMWNDDLVQNGWLICERTPSDAPRRPFVSYGDFTFLVLAARDAGPVVLKRSREQTAYDQIFALQGTRAHQGASFRLERAPERVTLAWPDAQLSESVAVLDTQESEGVAPDGSPVVYETLLLGGARSGAAFVIRPNIGVTQ